MSSHNHVDVRAASLLSYKLAEAEARRPRLFQARGAVDPGGGATHPRPASTDSDQTCRPICTSVMDSRNRGSALFPGVADAAPLMRGGVEISRWDSNPGRESSVDTRFTPDTLPGLPATTYLHTQATVGLDNRKWVDADLAGTCAARRLYAVTGHDVADRTAGSGSSRSITKPCNTFRSSMRPGRQLRGRAETTVRRSAGAAPI